MGEQNLPVVGGEYVFRGQNVRVVGTQRDPEPFEAVRLADWRKGVQ